MGDSSPNPKILDRLILADLVLSIASLQWSAHHPGPRSSPFVETLWIAVAAATVLSWIGLLYRVRPARVLYAVSWLGYLAFVALRGGVTTSATGSTLDLAAGLVGGLILGLVYSSEWRGSFETLRGVSGRLLSAP
jgi:hypothetical protein